MDTHLVAEHMRDLLAQEAGLLARLETLLEREAEALLGDDLPAIEGVGQDRHRCVEALMAIDAERRTACRMLGYGQDREQFEALLDRCDRSGTLKSRWHAGLEAAARCKDRNERNGAVVTAKLRRVEGLLMTLRGGQNQVAPVYGASGLRPMGGHGIELGYA